MRIVLISLAIAISIGGLAQQKNRFYYQRTMVLAPTATDEVMDLFKKMDGNDSSKPNPLNAALPLNQQDLVKAANDELLANPISTEEIYTKVKDGIIYKPADDYLIKLLLDKGSYLKGEILIVNGTETMRFDRDEHSFTTVVKSFQKTDSIKMINGLSCTLFELKLFDESASDSLLAEENVSVWATQLLNPALPLQALLMLKQPLKEMEHFTPVLLTLSSPNFRGAKDVIELKKVD